MLRYNSRSLRTLDEGHQAYLTAFLERAEKKKKNHSHLKSSSGNNR